MADGQRGTVAGGGGGVVVGGLGEQGKGEFISREKGTISATIEGNR